MAKVVAYTALNMISNPVEFGFVVAATPSQFTIRAGDQLAVHIGNFVYSGDMVSGTINTIEFYTGINLDYKVTGLTLDASDFFDALNGAPTTKEAWELVLQGNDTVDGSAGSDELIGGAGNDSVSGKSGNDDVNGDEGKDIVKGDAGNDDVNGGSGSDSLFGGAGKDDLTGGGGADNFIFNTALGASNVDEITDFNVAADTIRLENAIFKGLSGGTLKASAFASNNSGNATDAQDRIIYEKDTGKLFYDKDGTGGAAKVQFATLDKGLSLTHADFFVF